jgi:hypothetical protein
VASQWRTLAARVAVLLVSALLSLVLLEAGLWLLMPIEVHRISSQLYQSSYDPKLVYELKPSVLDHDSLGLRDVARTRAKPDGVFRVLLIGDSLAYGLGNRLENTYARRLERLLNAAGFARRVQVVNLGVPGYNIEQIVENLSYKGFAFEPDLVLYGYWLDDIGASMGSEGQRFTRLAKQYDQSGTGLALTADGDRQWLRWLALRTQVGRRIWLLLRARAEQLPTNTAENLTLTKQQVRSELGASIEGIYSAFYQRYASGALKDLPASEHYFASYLDYPRLRAWNAELRRLSELCRMHGVPVMMLLTPVLYDHPHDAYRFTELHAFVAAVAAAYGIESLDLGPVLAPHGAGIGVDSEHPNSEGSALIAGELANYLIASSQRFGLR